MEQVGSTFKDRLIAEKQQLDERLEKLSVFMSSETFKSIDKRQMDLLSIQAICMSQYSEILRQRLETL